MHKILTLTSSLLVVACGHAMAQQSNDQYLRRNVAPMQQSRPAEASISSPSALLQFIFPGYKPGSAAPATARQMQAGTNEMNLPSAQSATAAAAKNKMEQTAKPVPVAVPSQGQQSSTIYTPGVPKK